MGTSTEAEAPSYAALWVKSNYSFLEGASHPEELVQRAHDEGIAALAITDRDGVYGVVRAHLEATKLGQSLILGAQVTATRTDGTTGVVVLLARDRRGYGSLCQIISAGRLRTVKGSCEVTFEEVLGARGGLVALTPEPDLLLPLVEAYGDDAYAIVCRHRLAEDVRDEVRIRAAATLARVPVVAAVEVLYHDRTRRPLADIVTCIRHGCLLSTVGRRIRPNAENALPSRAEMAALFADDPAAVARTLEVADRCTFSLAQIRYRYPAEWLPEGHSETDWLRALTFEGARVRYGGVSPCGVPPGGVSPGGVPPDVTAQLERELALIAELEFGGYFLTMHEIVSFCRQENILCQGRGSAANSAVCYCLGITAIDPVRMELLFERFLSRERAEPPDIDLDIEHERREEVIQHVYERYGRRHAAMVANVVRYRTRSAVREVGKVLGIPATDVDGLARLLSYWSESVEPSTLVAAGLDAAAPSSRHLLELASELRDFPRHLSIHPGGFLLGHEPVDSIVPIEPATMEGRTVIQWDKQDIEDLGLFKVDLLGLGALTAIHRAFDLLRTHEGREIEMATVPVEDEATYEMVSRGDTVGVFQIESRAQMAMLPRLRPRTFYDLVIEVAIVRPGPIQGDMVHPYLRRRQGTEPVEFPHPSFEKVLRRTLGVPIFQEQVMKLAMLAADYSPGEADQLRRDMAAWRSKGRIEAHRDRLISRMIARGIPGEFAERVFAQIRGFGEYGFPESHAASFALLAYITAWLKCHHPAVFTCAMLNSQPMGFYAPSTLVEDVKRHSVTVYPVAVNHSQWDCTLTVDGGIRMGFRYIDGFGERERARFEAAPGPHRSLDAFVRATRLSQRACVRMAEAGAFEGFGLTRRQAIWRVRALAAYTRDSLELAVPDDTVSFAELCASDEIAWDYRASHHSARGHPMLALRPILEARKIPPAEIVGGLPDGRRLTYVGVVICRQRPGTATGVTFMTLEDETGFVNLVVWRPVFDRYDIIGRTAKLLGVKGRLQVANGVRHLIADELFRPDLALPDDRTPTARDFH